MRATLLVFVLFVQTGFGLSESLPISRSQTFHFQSEGIFVGGSFQSANLERIRFNPHLKEGTERWVIDFSDKDSRSTGKVAPRFQIRYIKAPKIEGTEAMGPSAVPPKFIFTFEKIEQNYLERDKLKKLVSKSRFLKDIILYPPIENGDLALEFILKDSVVFETHQPKEGQGRLVLDLKNAPL